MKKKMKFLAFLMAVLAVISMFAVAVSAEEITPASPNSVTSYENFSLGLDYTGTISSSPAVEKTTSTGYANVRMLSHSFELPPQYIYFSVCLKNGNNVTSSLSPSTNIFNLNYTSATSTGSYYQLKMTTEHRAANASGTWTPN